MADDRVVDLTIYAGHAFMVVISSTGTSGNGNAMFAARVDDSSVPCNLRGCAVFSMSRHKSDNEDMVRDNALFALQSSLTRDSNTYRGAFTAVAQAGRDGWKQMKPYDDAMCRADIGHGYSVGLEYGDGPAKTLFLYGMDVMSQGSIMLHDGTDMERIYNDAIDSLFPGMVSAETAIDRQLDDIRKCIVALCMSVPAKTMPNTSRLISSLKTDDAETHVLPQEEFTGSNGMCI